MQLLVSFVIALLALGNLVVSMPVARMLHECISSLSRYLSESIRIAQPSRNVSAPAAKDSKSEASYQVCY
jgi:hypothetical protein